MSYRLPIRTKVPVLAIASCVAIGATSCGGSEGPSASGGPDRVEAASERSAPRRLPSGIEVTEIEENRAPPLSKDPGLDPVMLDLMRATRKSFAALDVGPYRVVVEGTEARARAVAARTVKPVAESLSKQFFEKSPRKGIRIGLFAADTTYRLGAKTLTGERPDTPFGFYSSEISAVIMNLATGGGTLVHEIVHTFTETDFPEMPAWFNEGLGSLYEQCRILPDKLLGLTNWRLPALQDTLREDATGLLARLVATSTDEFYGPDSGLSYAVARYLCYDLQEKGLLERFYKDFRKNAEKDPTGRKTLEKLLGATLAEYEPGWRARTLRLRFPDRRAAPGSR